MNKDQMEMLSVKSAIERTVQSQITAMSSVYSKTHLDASKRLFEYVERYVAGLFASGQIDRDFAVHPSHLGIGIEFSTHGQKTGITFMLPSFLQWKPTTQKVDKPVDKQYFSSLQGTISQILATAINSIIQLGTGDTPETRVALSNVCNHELEHLQKEKHIYDYSVMIAPSNVSLSDVIYIDVAVKVEGSQWFHIPITAKPHLRPEKIAQLALPNIMSKKDVTIELKQDGNIDIFSTNNVEVHADTIYVDAYMQLNVPLESIQLNLINVELKPEKAIEAYNKAMKGIF